MEKSVDMLLVEHLEAIEKFAWRLTDNATDHEDLVQDVCERILSRASQFQPGTAFRSWAFRITETIWLDIVRAHTVRRGTTSIETVPEFRFATHEPERSIESRIALAETQRALTRLHSDHRATLLLVAFEGLSYKEAAAVMDVPIGTIMSRLARARAKLHATLGETQVV